MRIAMLSILGFFGVIMSNCGDKTFSVLPEIVITGTPHRLSSKNANPIAISKGKFYRQLSERGYSSVHGNAIFIFPEDPQMPREYEVAWLDCIKQGISESLLVTIDPNYHSLIDIYSYDPNQYRLASISESDLLPKHTDFMLLPPPNRPDTSLIQIDLSGKMESLALCCEF